MDGTKQEQRQQQIQNKVTRIVSFDILSRQIAKKLFDNAIENTKRYCTNYQNISEQLQLLEERHPHILITKQQQEDASSGTISTGINTNKTSSSRSFQQKDKNETSIDEHREIVRM